MTPEPSSLISHISKGMPFSVSIVTAFTGNFWRSPWKAIFKGRQQASLSRKRNTILMRDIAVSSGRKYQSLAEMGSGWCDNAWNKCSCGKTIIEYFSIIWWENNVIEGPPYRLRRERKKMILWLDSLSERRQLVEKPLFHESSSALRLGCFARNQALFETRIKHSI